MNPKQMIAVMDQLKTKNKDLTEQLDAATTLVLELRSLFPEVKLYIEKVNEAIKKGEKNG